MNKKKFIILLIAVLIAILILARLAISITKKKTSVDDFSTIKELVEYDGHKYISTKNSEENGFEKDIFIQFSNPPINDDGTTNQNSYEILIQHVGGKMLGRNFRIIDEDKDITIRIKFEEDKITTYTINNDVKYWKSLIAKYQTSAYSEEETTNFTINSEVIKNAISNNWKYTNINLGTKDSDLAGYDIYYDEGYKIRTINSKIYNIVFTKEYTGPIINQITTSTNIEEVERTLGKPTLTNDIENIIGYKSKDIYIFWGNDEISIYPVEEYNETYNKQFASIVTELNKSGDVNTFLNKLTDIYPDYETYYRADSYVKIIYPLKGFEVTIGAEQNNGITIYNNFKGYITKDISMENIVKNKQVPVNIYANLEKNLVLQAEEGRISTDEVLRNPYINIAKLETDEYVVMEEENIYQFISRDKTKIDSELQISNLTSIINYDQTTFIYGVKNNGIYVYNAETKELTKIVQGEGNFNNIKIENNRIYYDDKFLQL